MSSKDGASEQSMRCNYTSGTMKIEANDCQLVGVVCVWGGVHESWWL